MPNQHARRKTRANRPDADLSALELLSLEYSNVDSAIAEVTRLAAVQNLPKSAVHVISDIHGEDKKLQHVINNASGTLRPLVEEMFAESMNEEEMSEFLTLTFYPAEVTQRIQETLTHPDEVKAYAARMLTPQLELLRDLVSNLIHLLGRAIRNLAVDELVIGGDCWDRGPRGVLVVE